MGKARAAGPLAVVGLVALFVLSSFGPSTASHGAVGGTRSAISASVIVPALGAATNVSYLSTVDAFPLSYLEDLPAGFNNGTGAPLVIYLHGLGTSTVNVSGGININGDPLPFRLNATSAGYIAIAPNSRSDAGFFANTPCGGPQATDVLDAVASVERRHLVTSVWLAGFSGGSAGAFELAGNHLIPGVKGIATLGTITDYFQTFKANGLGTGHYLAYVHNECGIWPSSGPSAGNWTSAGEAHYLSPFRFYPQNFSAMRIYMDAGGLDVLAPSNFTFYAAYSNVNSTMSVRTCNVVASLGEPAGCTTPYDNLTTTAPWVEDYISKASHLSTAVNWQTVFAFFGNVGVTRSVTPGFYGGGTSLATQHLKSYAWERLPNPVIYSQGTGTGSSTAIAGLLTPAGSSIYLFDALNQTTALTISNVTDTVGDHFSKIATVTTNKVRAELWVANFSTGAVSNHVTATYSSAVHFSFAEVVLTGARTYASYASFGTGSATNTTTNANLSVLSPRSTQLTFACMGIATAYSPLYQGSVLEQENGSTTISTGLLVRNLTEAFGSLSQSTVTSGLWASIAVDVQGPSAPPTVTALTVANTTVSSISLTWTLPSGASTLDLNVTLYMGTTPGNYTTATSLFGVVSGTTVYGLPAGTKFYFAVQLWNTTGAGTLSGAVSGTTNATAGGGGGALTQAQFSALLELIVLAGFFMAAVLILGRSLDRRR